MGASLLRRKVHEAGHRDVTVVNKASSSLTDDVDVVVSHQDLTERVKLKSGSAIHVSVDDFMTSPRYDEIVALVEERNAGGVAGAAGAHVAEPEAEVGAEVLAHDSVVLRGAATSRDAAIEEAGQLLVAAGAVDAAYIAAMHERETSVSTAMGNLLAILHGTNEAKGSIRRTAISFVRYADESTGTASP